MSRDTCDNCGSDTFGEGHFAVGKLWCAECWSGQHSAMPPTPAYRRQIELWLAPKVPPAQQTLSLAQATQAQGASRG